MTTDRSTVRRIPARGSNERSDVFAVLDAGFMAHVGFAIESQPFVIPTLYGRDGERLYIHGSAASRMLRTLEGGVPACLAVTHVDGIVLARSAFNHSMNYRSAIVFGQARKLASDEEKTRALRTISEHLLPGRWNDVRAPNAQELKATTVLEIVIEEASAKVRSGPPEDDPEDHGLEHWAGVLPLRFTQETAIPDPQLHNGIPKPGYLERRIRGTSG
jgi:uncharacterized protein